MDNRMRCCIILNYIKKYTVFIAVFLVQSVSAQEVWTNTKFPSYIKRLTYFGERADWSHDGKKILFLGRNFGDAYEYDLETGIITPVTHHYYHGGYTRAQYLSNGDILLSGPRQFNPEEAFEWRRFRSELWVLDKSLKKPPSRLGTYCFEGPAVSRRKLQIAWTQNFGHEGAHIGLHTIWISDIDYKSGSPELNNQRNLVDNRNPQIKGAILETQSFRPPHEEELIFQSTIGVETFGINLKTGVLANYTNTSNIHEEPEGIFPDGLHTLVESDLESTLGKWAENVDIYRLKLDGSGKMNRLTFFAESGLFKGTNPVVSDDGRFIAFQVAHAKSEAGIGMGIYIYDIEKAKKENAKSWEINSERKD